MAATTIIYWLEDAQRVYHWHQYRMAMKVHQGLNTFIYFFSVFYLIYTLQKCSVCSVSLWEKISHSRSTRTAPAQQLLPDIQRRSIQDWHRTISWWRSWRGEKACCRQSTVPLKSGRETRDSVQIESRVSGLKDRDASDCQLTFELYDTLIKERRFNHDNEDSWNQTINNIWTKLKAE